MPGDDTHSSEVDDTRRRVNRRAVLSATTVAGIGSLAGCLSNIGGSGSSETVTYGVINPMHGSYSSLGPFQRKGAKLAIKHINNSDRYDFELKGVYGDTETDPSAATQNASKLIQKEGADFLMGAISSSVGLALNSFAAKNKVVYNPGAAAIPITGSKCNGWVYRAETNTAQIAEACAPWTLTNLGSKVWFHIADYAYGRSVLKEWRSRMKNADSQFTEVGVTRANLGAKNFEPYISQIKGSDADVLVVGSTGSDFVRFAKQAASQGLKNQVPMITTTASFQSLRAGLGSAGYGIHSGVRYNAKIDTGDNQQFVKDYKNEYNDVPGNFARVAYDSIRMTAEGMKQAGTTDPAKVKNKLAGTSVKSLFGQNSFRSCNHQATNPVWVGKNVKPNSGTTADVKLLDKTSGKNAIPPCSQVNCTL